MFNLFKSKYKKLSEYPNDKWSVLTEKEEGLIIRMNDGLREAVGHPDYPVKMGVAVPLDKERGEDILKLKDGIEEKINKFLESNGVIVSVINKMKEPKFFEFLSYTNNGLNFNSLGESLKNGFPGVDIQMYAKLDPKWETYKSFLSRKNN
ncbi:MAG: DUF695 domain-containing protein [bacterium]|nr:DUF695 domain-containing protein [bacterium]